MTDDREISIWSLLQVAAWSLVAGALAAGWWLEDLYLQNAALAVSAAAAALTIRGYIVKQNRLIRSLRRGEETPPVGVRTLR
jgi:hypothetical protein